MTLYTLEKKMDVGKALVEDGLLLVDRKVDILITLRFGLVNLLNA